MRHARKKQPKKIQTFRISRELVQEIHTLATIRKHEFKNQTALIIALLELGYLEEYLKNSHHMLGRMYISPLDLQIRVPTLALQVHQLQLSCGSGTTATMSFLPPFPNLGADKDPEPELGQLSVRLPIELLDRIEWLAVRRAPRHNKQKITLTPTILHLIELGIKHLNSSPTVSATNLIGTLDRQAKNVMQKT
jgi:hypothetical protein